MSNFNNVGKIVQETLNDSIGTNLKIDGKIGNNTIDALNNISVYENWDKQNYDQRKKFITGALNILIDKFPNQAAKPKVYFQGEIIPLYPKNIPLPGALFYSPELSPWANDMIKSAIGSNEPFFAFFLIRP